MSFQGFDQINHYLDTVNLDNYKTGAAAYFKSKDCVAEYQAYIRGTPTGPTTIVNALRAAFVTPPLPPAITAVAYKQRLYAAVDTLWTTTIQPSGRARLIAEATARLNHYTMGAGQDTCPDLDNYFKQGIDVTHIGKHLITPVQCNNYTELLSRITQPWATDDGSITYNQNRKQEVKARDAIAAVRAMILGGMLTDPSGAAKTDEAKWSTVEECSNYWRKELPNVQSRRAALQQVEQWTANGTGTVIKRRVSDGEKESLEKTKRMTQGPASYERHKWFFRDPGAPGVDYPWVFEILLKGEGWAFLTGLATEVADEAKATAAFPFVTKSNEPNCIGIHEEMLQPFHRMIDKITIKSNKSTVQFTPKDIRPV